MASDLLTETKYYIANRQQFIPITFTSIVIRVSKLDI